MIAPELAKAYAHHLDVHQKLVRCISLGEVKTVFDCYYPDATPHEKILFLRDVMRAEQFDDVKNYTEEDFEYEVLIFLEGTWLAVLLGVR